MIMLGSQRLDWLKSSLNSFQSLCDAQFQAINIKERIFTQLLGFYSTKHRRNLAYTPNKHKLYIL